MQKLKLKIHYCLVNHLVINTSVLYRSPFLQWQGDVDVIAPSLHVDVETAVGACRTFLVGDDKAVGDDNHAATGLGLHLVRHIELEGLHRAVVQTHFEIEVVGAFRGAGAVAVVVAGVVGNAEGFHCGLRTVVTQGTVEHHGSRFRSGVSVVQIDALGHACQCSACEGHVLKPLLELVAHEVGIGERLQTHGQTDSLLRGQGLVAAYVCAVKHVGLVHGTFPRVQGFESPPRQATGGGTCGSQCGDVVEDDVFRVIVVEQQVVRTFVHIKTASFGRQVALVLGGAAGIDACTDAGGHVGAKVVIALGAMQGSTRTASRSGSCVPIPAPTWR